MTSADMPTILVIVGITGDLSRRKLLPAIEEIAAAGAAPERFRVIGITRQEIQIGEVLDQVKKSADHHFLAEHLEVFQMDMTSSEDYSRLGKRLDAIEKEFGASAQRLFYLSIPPQVADQVVHRLGESGLAKMPHTKLLLEKPFGTDLASAQELVGQVKHYFQEEQVYRIDHYLAKEMTQNFIVFRTDNSLFRRTWNKDFIESIEIVATERIGIEGRVGFYEQTGALRDIIQSHLLQLAALTLMETPSPDALKSVPRLRLAALKHLRLPGGNPQVIRGQYEGYRDAAQAPKSNVETYVDVALASDDPRWKGVPIRLITGKNLKQKQTEIRVAYRKDEDHEANELVIKIQPDEGIVLHIWTKAPGYDRQVQRHTLKLAFKEHYPTLPDAYEQVLLDAINSNHALFATSEEVLETWRIIDPIQQTWAMSSHNLRLYQPGTDAPIS